MSYSCLSGEYGIEKNYKEKIYDALRAKFVVVLEEQLNK